MNMSNIDIALDEARRKLDFQAQQIDGLDTKSGIILGADGVLIALFIPIISTHSNLINEILVKIALIPIFISLVLSLVSLSNIKFNNPPNLNRLWSHYVPLEDSSETKLEITKAMISAVSENEKPIKVKSNLWRYSYISLSISIGMLLVLAFIL